MAIWHEEYELYRKYTRNIARFYKNPQAKAYLELSLTLLAIIIFLVFAIRPTVTTITQKLKEMQDKQEVVNKLNTKIDTLSIANSLLQENKATLDLLETAIPDDPTPEDYVAQISALIVRHNTVLDNITIEDAPIVETSVFSDELSEQPITVGTIEWFPFTMIVTGTYEDLNALMTSVENLRRGIRIRSATIEEDLEGGLKLILLGDIPYYKDE